MVIGQAALNNDSNLVGENILAYKKGWIAWASPTLSLDVVYPQVLHDRIGAGTLKIRQQMSANPFPSVFGGLAFDFEIFDHTGPIVKHAIELIPYGIVMKNPDPRPVGLGEHAFPRTHCIDETFKALTDRFAWLTINPNEHARWLSWCFRWNLFPVGVDRRTTGELP